MRAVALTNPEGCEADTMANIVRPLRCTLSVPVKPSTCQSGATNQGSPSAKQQATHSRGSGYAYPPRAGWGLSELPGWAGRPGWLAGGGNSRSIRRRTSLLQSWMSEKKTRKQCSQKLKYPRRTIFLKGCIRNMPGLKVRSDHSSRKGICVCPFGVADLQSSVSLARFL